MKCPRLQCGPREVLIQVDGECCSACIPRPVIDPPYRPRSHTYTDPSDPCKMCSYSYGRTACLDMSGFCPRNPSDCGQNEHLEPEVEAGKCCPFKCVDNLLAPPQHRGLLRPRFRQCEGEGPIPTDDSCMECSCSNGLRACQDVSNHCEVLTCERTVHPEGQCCPVCDDKCEDNSTKIENCRECICFNGEFHCLDYDESLCEEPTTPAPPPSYKQGTGKATKGIVDPSLGDDGSLEGGCVTGKAKRMPNCMRCRCNDGLRFSCFYDPTLCRPGQRGGGGGPQYPPAPVNGMKIKVSTSKLLHAQASARGEGTEIVELVNRALEEAGVEVVSIETTSYNRIK